MSIVVLHIGNPPEADGQPFICLEDFEPATGIVREVDESRGPVPPQLLAQYHTLLDELVRGGGETGTRAHIGVELYKYIAATNAGRLWIERCKASGQRNRNGQWDQPMLRSYLQIEPESLQHLPWELMVESIAASAFAPFRSRNHLAARGHPNDQSRPQPTLSGVLPLAILVAIYDIEDTLHGEERFRATPQTEVDAIFAALRDQPGIWQVEVLRNPTDRDLRNALHTIRPHILHFIGEPSGQDPEFNAKLSDNTYESFRVSALERFLAEIDNPPRLFVLNGCRTTDMASPEVFRELGSKAVITNQAIVYGPPAVTFSKVFYQKLAETCDVAEAVWAARTALWSIQRDDKYDWGIPVLTLHDGPEKIIQDDLPVIAKTAKDLIQAGDYGEPAWHVDRLPESRQVWGRVGTNQPIALISGRKDIGKSWLLRTCMLTWKLRGHPAVLFDGWNTATHKPTQPTLLTILEHICTELLTDFDSMPTIRDRLAEFLANLGSSADFEGNGDNDDAHPYERPCREFISILSEAATVSRPLMLAFDNLRGFYQPDLQKWLKNHIFQPIARGKAGATYIVIAVEGIKNNPLGWWEPEWAHWTKQVPLKKFTYVETDPIAHEYGARRGYFKEVQFANDNHLMAQWVKEVGESPDFRGDWLPVELCELANDFDQRYARDRQ